MRKKQADRIKIMDYRVNRCFSFIRPYVDIVCIVVLHGMPPITDLISRFNFLEVAI